VEEDAQPGVILLKSVGQELGNASVSGRIGQLIKQEGTDPVVLEVIGYHECHLGFVGARMTVESTHCNQLIINFGHQSESVLIVNTREAFHFCGGEYGVEREET
jgi:hypothetical protein